VKHGKSGEMTANRLKKDTSVRDTEGEVTTRKLNVTTAAARLPAAEAAVERGDWPAADVALAEIQTGVVQTTANDEMPLMRARENLELARARILENKYADAVVPLRAAAQALADFQKMYPGPRAEQAEFMRQQIAQYAGMVRHDHSDAADRIKSWLDPINQWYQEAISR
jgi:ABC-type amino acid transport substrate-binding protein